MGRIRIKKAGYMKRLIILFMITAYSLSLFGAEDKDYVLFFKTKNNKRLGLTGAPYLAYSSDSGAGLGTQIVLFDATEDSLKVNPFELQFDVSLTTEDERKLEIDYTKTFTKQKMELISHIEYKRKPSDFWGIGSDTQEENVESYTHEQALNKIQLKKQLNKHLSFGPVIAFNYYNFIERVDSMFLANAEIPGTENSFITSGIGYTVDYNRTDTPKYPRNGFRVIKELVFYSKALASDYSFVATSLDLRGYKSIFNNHILCAQVLSQHTSDNPPFQHYPKQGSSSIMRGYANGRFIDKQFFGSQVEYRTPFFMRTGLAVFAACGNSYKNFSDFKMDNTHYAYGLGFRFNVSKSNMLNLRGDLAFSEEGKEIYFKVGEAF